MRRTRPPRTTKASWNGLTHLLVHFDIEKIPAMAWQADRTRRLLDASGVEWIEAGEILFGRSHAQKTANWLAWTEASRLAQVPLQPSRPLGVPRAPDPVSRQAAVRTGDDTSTSSTVGSRRCERC